MIKLKEKTKRYIKKVLCRAIRTVAQTAVALLPVSATIESVDWKVVISTSLLSGVASILTSIARGKGDKKDESKI